MKRLGFRSAYLSTDKKARARTKRSQTTEPQLFYIVCYRAFFFLIQLIFCHLLSVKISVEPGSIVIDFANFCASG